MKLWTKFENEIRLFEEIELLNIDLGLKQVNNVSLMNNNSFRTDIKRN